MQNNETVVRTSTGPVTKNSQTVLLATVQSDAHMWNLVFIEMLLAEQGHRVVNLGQCTPIDVVVAAALHHRPDAVVISTVNGHGHLDGPELAKALRDLPGLEDIRLMIGGKLGIRGEQNIEYFGALIAAGFDAVYDASNPVQGQGDFLQLLAAPSLKAVSS